VTPRTLRVVVADDERPARRFLVGLLTALPDVDVVGEAANGDEALAAIAEYAPDLALLDLQMPGMTGLDVARAVPAAGAPLLAFVTAYDDHAVEAFEVNAIDYLLKPVEAARLEATVARVRERLAQPAATARQPTALAQASAAIERARQQPLGDRLPLRQGDAIELVPIRSIASITADGELLHVRTVTGGRYTVTHRLHALEGRLAGRRFLRLGRGLLVNADHVARVVPMPGSTYAVVLTTGEELPVSRIQSRVVRETLLKL
jgi:two-component system LytT family response regulator